MGFIYTIGFTKKSAEVFFEALIKRNIETLVDIRLNNTSQLAGFSKYPDIEYFLSKLCKIKYVHDVMLAPDEDTLDRYKKKMIDWDEYIVQFNQTMLDRDIMTHIREKYSFIRNICLLCSEEKADKCHRSLIAERFAVVTNSHKVIHI